jgi:signal transduction histidine kinase
MGEFSPIRWHVVYNSRVSSSISDETKSYVGFTDEDAGNVRAIGAFLRPCIPAIVDRFYQLLLRHPSARAVFSGGQQQMARQHAFLTGWLQELFEGTYDDSYIDKRLRIGAAHARVQLPQRYMVLGMEIIWQELVRELHRHAIEGIEQKLASLHKLLSIDLAIMLESYKEGYSEEIRRLERDFMEAKLVRAEHLAQIGQLAATLAHEIKNPLAGISGAIQIIREGLPHQSPHHPIIGDILNQIGRLDATVRDLLLYARPTPAKPRPFRLDRLVMRVASLLQEEPAMQRVRVEFHETGDSTVFADEGQVEQLLINLLLNAAHASHDGQPVRVEVEPQGERARLVVRDFGTGMPPEVLERAQEPFFTTKARGSGLGLAICRRVAETNGGSIAIESEVNRGTTVIVDLPRTAETLARV